MVVSIPFSQALCNGVRAGCNCEAGRLHGSNTACIPPGNASESREGHGHHTSLKLSCREEVRMPWHVGCSDPKPAGNKASPSSADEKH